MHKTLCKISYGGGGQVLPLAIACGRPWHDGCITSQLGKQCYYCLCDELRPIEWRGRCSVYGGMQLTGSVCAMWRYRRVWQEHVHQTDAHHPRSRLLGRRPTQFHQARLSEYLHGYELHDSRHGHSAHHLQKPSQRGLPARFAHSLHALHVYIAFFVFLSWPWMAFNDYKAIFRRFVILNVHAYIFRKSALLLLLL